MIVNHFRASRHRRGQSFLRRGQSSEGVSPSLLTFTEEKLRYSHAEARGTRGVEFKKVPTPNSRIPPGQPNPVNPVKSSPSAFPPSTSPLQPSPSHLPTFPPSHLPTFPPSHLSPFTFHLSPFTFPPLSHLTPSTSKKVSTTRTDPWGRSPGNNALLRFVPSPVGNSAVMHTGETRDQGGGDLL